MARSKTSPARRERRRAELVERWRRSGQSAAAFAREHGVSQWTLYSWGRRVTKAKEEDARRPSGRPRVRSRATAGGRIDLIPVRLVGGDTARREGPTADGGAVVEIELRSGDLVRLIGNVAVERVRSLLLAVRQAC